MSTIDWTLLGIMVVSGAVVILGAGILWIVARTGWRLASRLRSTT